jgi:hypothetical protein
VVSSNDKPHWSPSLSALRCLATLLSLGFCEPKIELPSLEGW